MSRAKLLYHFGAILREDITSFQTFQPFDLRNYYVQIRIANPFTQQVQPVWTGIIDDNDYDLYEPSGSTGDQEIDAFGLAHLLDRLEIEKAHVQEPDGTIGTIPHVPTFNERNSRGRGLFGNRSSALFSGSYIFSTKGEVWTNKNIVNYLISKHIPDTLPVKIAGQYQLLDDLVDYHSLGGKTIWTALNELIDRRRGLMFWLDATTDEEIVIVVRSMADRDIKYGKKTLPACDLRTSFTTPTNHPYSHLVDNIHMRFTTQDSYDEILVRGERIKVMGTFSKKDGTLEAGWSEELEQAYIDEGQQDAKSAHRERSKDKYDEVYSRFIVPRKWDGRCGDGKGGHMKNILVSAKDDGTIDEKNRSGFWLGSKTFLRETFLVAGKDYSRGALPGYNPDDQGQHDQVPLIGLINDVVDLYEPRHGATNRQYYIDRISEAGLIGADKSLSVRPLDKDLGFQISGAYRHYMGLDHILDNGDDDALQRPMEFNWENLSFVACMEIDERQRVRISRSKKGPVSKAGRRAQVTNDMQRTLTLDVPGAEYWYIHRWTIVDIDDKGEPEYVTDTDRLKLRDDKEKLQAVAAFAAAWYGRVRQAVRIPIHGLGMYAQLGTLVETVDGVSAYTPVTARHMDFTADNGAGVTVMETDFSALDLVATATESNFKARRRRRFLS